MAMTEKRIREITKERLHRWTERLVEQHSTPFVLVGVGHDHNIGQVVVLTCEEATDEQIIATLRGAADLLDGR